ncbi:hypothetical protein MATL_G00010960 [Megalops atlanticus]|uniref:Uncharacterized protein n=1 Tax=Megalops atlanticus TaxID=7932 RepID=A0A9D3TDW5_MEGAT|nr:hypothetical protein MATL_G00010960 [Megalops atlanticus]
MSFESGSLVWPFAALQTQKGRLLYFVYHDFQKRFSKSFMIFNQLESLDRGLPSGSDKCRLRPRVGYQEPVPSWNRFQISKNHGFDKTRAFRFCTLVPNCSIFQSRSRVNYSEHFTVHKSFTYLPGPATQT